MEVLHTILTVLFVFVSFILVTLILLQNNRSSGASLFGGGNQSAFGASSADALTKMTAVLVATFMILAMALAFLRSRATNVDDLRNEFKKQSTSEMVVPIAPSTEGEKNPQHEQGSEQK